VGLGWYLFVRLSGVPALYHYAWPLALAMVYFELYNSRSQAQQKVVLPSFLRLVGRRLLMTIALLLLYWQDWGGDALMLVLTAGYGGHLVILAGRKYGYVPGAENASKEGLRRKDIVRYSLFIVMAATVTMVVSRIDVLMIRGLIGPEAVTLYTIAFFMGSVVGLPGRALSTSLRPVLSKAFARSDMQQVSEVYKRAAQSQFYINGTVLLLILANFNWVMLLLPEDYRVPGLVVLLIGLSQVVQTSAGPNGLILQLSERVHYNLYVALLLLFLTLLLNASLIPQLGIMGAALSALTAISIFNLTRGYLVYRDLKIKPYAWRWSYSVVLYLLLLAICAYTAQAPFGWFNFSISNGLVLIYALFILRTSRLFPANTVLSSLRKLLKF
jgi:O-antigen/teichoic acid export membrane protein